MRKLYLAVLASLLALSVVLGGCSTNSTGTTATEGAASSGSATIPVAATTTSGVDNFDFEVSDRDLDSSYDEAGATRIEFSTANQVETITAEGTYIVSGQSEGGQLIVDLSNAENADDAKAQVVLDGLTLSNSSAPALLVAQADKVFITLAPGSSNSLSDGSGRSDLAAGESGDSDADAAADAAVDAEAAEDAEDDSANENATLYSHDDLTINGSGSLSVSSTANHAIKCQDDLVIAEGNITVEAGVDGIRGKDSVKIVGGNVQVKAGDDGIVSTQTSEPYEQGFVYINDGSVTVDAADDGIKGEALVCIAGGTVDVANSTEGLEAPQIWIDGGNTTVKSTDDGVNAAGDIRNDYLLAISGGTLYVDAEGDGLDSNNALTQSGGDVIVVGPARSGNGALDAERSATISGGSMLATDTSNMSMSYGPESTQAALLYLLPATQAANTPIALVDSSGKALFNFASPKQVATLAYSSPELKVGESYSFVAGGVTNDAGTITGGTTLTSFTLSEQCAQIDGDGTVSAYSGQGMMGGFGGGPGGGRGGAPEGGAVPDGAMAPDGTAPTGEGRGGGRGQAPPTGIEGEWTPPTEGSGSKPQRW